MFKPSKLSINSLVPFNFSFNLKSIAIFNLSKA